MKLIKKNIYIVKLENYFQKMKKLHEITNDAILECHKYLRVAIEPSEISRFYKCFEFFQKYFSIKDEYLNIDINGKEKLYKIKSIICSIYICYYYRLNNYEKREGFDLELREILLKLVNAGEELEKEKDIIEKAEGSFLDRIKYKVLKTKLKRKEINHFSDLLKLEEEFLLNLIELDTSIVKNNSLKENIYLSFISIINKPH